MTYKTWADVRESIEKELDLAGETFVDPVEMVGYANQAIAEAESHIHKLGVHDQYFLRPSDPVAIVNGTSEYSAPSDIFANKVTKLIWSENNQRVFEVLRMTQKDRFVEAALIEAQQPTSLDTYQYMIINRTATEGVKIKLYPTPNVSGNFLTIWYLRRATQIVDDSSIVDIPEFYTFITQYVKWKVCAKETHPNTLMEYQELQRVRDLMIQTLENMVPDQEDKIEMDMSFYEEMA